jgi:hypothetical protein
MRNRSSRTENNACIDETTRVTCAPNRRTRRIPENSEQRSLPMKPALFIANRPAASREYRDGRLCASHSRLDGFTLH